MKSRNRPLDWFFKNLIRLGQDKMFLMMNSMNRNNMTKEISEVASAAFHTNMYLEHRFGYHQI